MDTVRLIVECTRSKEWEEFISRFATLKYSLPMISSYVVEVPDDKALLLDGLPGVIQVSRSSAVTAQMNAARKAVSAERQQKLGITGRGVTIAILDTGISPIDDFIKPRSRIIAFKDFVNGRADAYDDNGHGTHVTVLKTLQSSLIIHFN